MPVWGVDDSKNDEFGIEELKSMRDEWGRGSGFRSKGAGCS